MNNISERPPIGLIVEGEGEYYSFPSIISNLLGNGQCPFCPRVNAGGNGNIYRHLDRYICSLVSAYKPYSVIICTDLVDYVNQGIVNNCRELLTLISDGVDTWNKTYSHLDKFNPIPTEFVSIIQIPKFEAWAVADANTLQNLGYIAIQGDDIIEWSNVDEQVLSPSSWLKHREIKRLDLKQPKVCKTVFSALSVQTMEDKSRSFRKFSKEIKRLYSKWCFDLVEDNTTLVAS